MKLDTFLSWLMGRLDIPAQVIGGGPGATSLMERYALVLFELRDRWPFVRLSFRDAADRNKAKLVLHRFLRGDNRVLGVHSHPWWFGSITLGTYVEEFVNGLETERRVRGPGSVAIHPPSYQHVVIDVPDGPCWTLAILGPRSAEWGFPAAGVIKRRAPTGGIS